MDMEEQLRRPLKCLSWPWIERSRSLSPAPKTRQSPRVSGRAEGRLGEDVVLEFGLGQFKKASAATFTFLDAPSGNLLTPEENALPV